MSTVDKISTISNLPKDSNALQKSSGDFSSILKESLNEVNKLQKEGDKAMSDLATGSVKDLHQAAIAIDKAEISMKLMLEVRNKALSAYKELSRTQM